MSWPEHPANQAYQHLRKSSPSRIILNQDAQIILQTIYFHIWMFVDFQDYHFMLKVCDLPCSSIDALWKWPSWVYPAADHFKIEWGWTRTFPNLSEVWLFPFFLLNPCKTQHGKCDLRLTNNKSPFLWRFSRIMTLALFGRFTIFAIFVVRFWSKLSIKI